MQLYIGLMSGTSADGVDAALVDFSDTKPRLVATHYAPHDTSLRQQIHALCQSGQDEIDRLGQLDVRLGHVFAQSVHDLLKKAAIDRKNVVAIGSHGQTIRHRNQGASERFTLQIGDPNIIAAKTGITTIADFRRKDMAMGGQGAPLVPAFHQILFSDQGQHRAIVNIGGIANITLLPQATNTSVIGFDTGPGNVLLDEWIRKHSSKSYDENGAWAATGKIQTDLLAQLLADPYFALPPPKSTGREHFNLMWLEQHISGRDFAAQDIQATLAELTARSIIDAIKKNLASGEILVCGGGSRNHSLMQRITELAKPALQVTTTHEHGLDPEWVEAVAFAWLAKQTINRLPGNLPSVTGAEKPVILGGIYYS